MDKLTQKGTVERTNPNGQYGAGVKLEGHKNWLNFEEAAAKFCPNAGDEIEYKLSESGKIGFVKVVGRKEAVVLKDVDVSMKAYLEDSKHLWSEVQNAWPADKELARLVFDKALAPYKYWVDNKLRDVQ